MPVSTCHDRPTQPETQASTPEQSDRAMSFRDDGIRIQQQNLAVPRESGARVIPWFKQILKVFICGLAARNGPILKVL